MRKITVLMCLIAITGMAQKTIIIDSRRPKEVLLTKERLALVRAIKERPIIIKQERVGDNLILHWENGATEWVTTNAIRPVIAERATGGWQEKVDKLQAEKAEILNDIKAIQKNPTASKISTILNKHEEVVLDPPIIIEKPIKGAATSQ